MEKTNDMISEYVKKIIALLHQEDATAGVSGVEVLFLEKEFLEIARNSEFITRLIGAILVDESGNRKVLLTLLNTYEQMNQTDETEDLIQILKKKIKDTKRVPWKKMIPLALVLAVALFFAGKHYLEQQYILSKGYDEEEIIELFESTYGFAFDAEVIKMEAHRDLSLNDRAQATIIYEMEAEVLGETIPFEARVSWDKEWMEFHFDFEGAIWEYLMEEQFPEGSVSIVRRTYDAYKDEFAADYNHNAAMLATYSDTYKLDAPKEYVDDYYILTFDESKMDLDECKAGVEEAVSEFSKIKFGSFRKMHFIIQIKSEGKNSVLAEVETKVEDDGEIKETETKNAEEVIPSENVSMKKVQVEALEFELPDNWMEDIENLSDYIYVCAPGGNIIEACAGFYISKTKAEGAELLRAYLLNENEFKRDLEKIHEGPVYEYNMEEIGETFLGDTYKLSYYIYDEGVRMDCEVYYGFYSNEAYAIAVMRWDGYEEDPMAVVEHVMETGNYIEIKKGY